MLLRQLLLSIIFALLWQSSSVGHKKRKCSTIQGTHDAMCTEVADIDPTDRTREDWESLNHEGLVLACETHILATGSSRVLVIRLVEFYHSAPSCCRGRTYFTHDLSGDTCRRKEDC